MKFKDLFAVIEPGTRLVIDYNYEMLQYRTDELYEDSLFYESIKDKEVETLWYSIVYKAQVIKLI